MKQEQTNRAAIKFESNMKTGKKILVVTTTPLCVDGLTEVMINISEIAKERNNAILTFALAEGAEPQIENKLKEIGVIHTLSSRKKHLLKYIKELKKLTRDERYDIIHIHGNSSTMAFDLLACKNVKTRVTHCHNCAKQSALKTMTLGMIMNKLVTCPVACSQKAGEALYTKPFIVIRNGIDTDRFHFSTEIRKAKREELGINEAYVIGHIGRFSEQKNHMRLISIFEKVLHKRPESILLLCGTGELEQKIKQEVAQRGLENQVIFAGVVSNPQDYLMSMDILVLPSLFEGLPLVGVEAQATGLPCVFADSITDEVIIVPETEFLPLNESDERWAEVICKDRTVHREEAAELVENAGYGINKVQEQVRALYNSAL